MRFRKPILLFLLLLLGSNFIYSQKIFREGFIIKNSSDTLNGLIQFEENQKINQKFMFKRFDIAVSVTYTPETIKSFGYKNGNYFETMVINGNKTFLECLLKGKLSLYALSKRLFIEDGKKGLVELKNSSIEITNDNKNYTFVNATDLLTFLTRDVAGINIPVKIKLVDAELIPIIKEYNQKANAKYIVYNRKVNTNIFEDAIMLSGINHGTYGFIAGLNMANLVLNTTYNYYNNPVSDVNLSSKNLSLGLFYNKRLSRLDDKFSLQLECIVTKQSFYGYQEINRRIPSEIQRVDLFENTTIIKIPLMIQYSISKGKIIPFLNFGVDVNYYLKSKSNQTLEAENSNHEIYTFENNTSDNMRAITEVLSLGAYYKISGGRKVFVEFRSEYGKGLSQLIKFNYTNSPMLDLTQKSLSFSFLMGISL